MIDVHPSLPIQTLKELVAYAKANPGKLSYGSVRRRHHEASDRRAVQGLTGTDIAHVPYRGAGPAMTDLISGHIPMITPKRDRAAIELHKTGKLRILAVTSATRVAAAPDIPTVGRSRDAGPDLAELHRPVRTDGDAEGDRRADRAGDANRRGRPRPAADVPASGFEPELDSEAREGAPRSWTTRSRSWTPVIRSIGLKLD